MSKEQMRSKKHNWEMKNIKRILQPMNKNIIKKKDIGDDEYKEQKAEYEPSKETGQNVEAKILLPLS